MQSKMVELDGHGWMCKHSYGDVWNPGWRRSPGSTICTVQHGVSWAALAGTSPTAESQYQVSKRRRKSGLLECSHTASLDSSMIVSCFWEIHRLSSVFNLALFTSRWGGPIDLSAWVSGERTVLEHCRVCHINYIF